MTAKSSKNFWGFRRTSLVVASLQVKGNSGGRRAEVIVHAAAKSASPKRWREQFEYGDSKSAQLIRAVDNGRLVRLLVSPLAVIEVEGDPRLKTHRLARIREAMGALVQNLERLEIDEAEIDLDLKDEEAEAALTGLEIALYRFKRVFKDEGAKFKMVLLVRGRTLSPRQIEEQSHLGKAINLARHLVNLPPNELNPVSYANFAKGFLQGLPGVKVDVWDEKRLVKEKMGLMLAVGKGSPNPPRLVHIRYRPAGAKSTKPVAFVGKGITFDSGGLDIKSSSNMRLMKKDMGGSAAVMGLALWAALCKVKTPLDFYLALAENSVSGDSFRPSDVLFSRNGMSVEIHNTDAEGRLVLADALDVAVTGKEKPRAVIDVATLTGAIKVGLGSGLAGLFSNDNKLSAALQEAGREAGDLVWPMPLMQRYRSGMNSNFADTVNAVDGFGGAVTAALFLQKFVKETAWAHLDIYAWKDSADGACNENGGSGQAVAGLARWLSRA